MINVPRWIIAGASNLSKSQMERANDLERSFRQRFEDLYCSGSHGERDRGNLWLHNRKHFRQGTAAWPAIPCASRKRSCGQVLAEGIQMTASLITFPPSKNQPHIMEVSCGHEGGRVWISISAAGGAAISKALLSPESAMILSGQLSCHSVMTRIGVPDPWSLT